MRRTSLALALATTLVVGLAASPVMAAPGQPVGDRVDLRIVDQAFPASTPFHIDHGYLHETGDQAIGLDDFMLDMDGTVLTADFLDRDPARDSGLSFSVLWYYNFPSGLTGTHEFTRHYFQACNDDTVPCDGNRIRTPVQVLAVTATVTFTP